MVVDGSGDKLEGGLLAVPEGETHDRYGGVSVIVEHDRYSLMYVLYPDIVILGRWNVLTCMPLGKGL